MPDKSDFKRLSEEYVKNYSYDDSRTTNYRSVLFGYVMSAVLIAVLIIAIAAFDGLHGLFGAVLPILAVASAAATVYEKVKYDKTERLIAESTAYVCYVTECGIYAEGGRYSRSMLLFKFVYIKNGTEVTDMCLVEFSGVFTGDLSGTHIVLHETRGGRKVVSVFIPRMGEYRVLYR